MTCSHCGGRHPSFVCPLERQARDESLRASRIESEWGDTVLVWTTGGDHDEIYLAVEDIDGSSTASAVLTGEEALTLSRHLATAASVQRAS